MVLDTTKLPTVCNAQYIQVITVHCENYNPAYLQFTTHIVTANFTIFRALRVEEQISCRLFNLAVQSSSLGGVALTRVRGQGLYQHVCTDL